MTDINFSVFFFGCLDVSFYAGLIESVGQTSGNKPEPHAARGMPSPHSSAALLQTIGQSATSVASSCPVPTSTPRVSISLSAGLVDSEMTQKIEHFYSPVHEMWYQRHGAF